MLEMVDKELSRAKRLPDIEDYIRSMLALVRDSQPQARAEQVFLQLLETLGQQAIPYEPAVVRQCDGYQLLEKLIAD